MAKNSKKNQRREKPKRRLNLNTVRGAAALFKMIDKTNVSEGAAPENMIQVNLAK